MLRLTSLLILICLVTVLFFVRHAQPFAPLVQVTTTAEQSLNLNPIISDDGNVLVFESNSNLGSGSQTSFHTIRTNISGVGLTLDEIAPSRSNAATLSGNGRFTAFASTEDLIGENADRNSEIYLVDGSALKQLTHTTPLDENSRTTDGNYEPSISAEGRLIAFSSNRYGSSNVRDIVILDTVSQQISPITNNANHSQATNPKLSADGSRIYFLNTTNLGEMSLMLWSSIDHTVQIVSENITGLSLAPTRVLSSDGNRLVYSAITGVNQSQVFLYDYRTRENHQLTHLGTRSSDVPLNPSISGDGKRVTFATRRRTAEPSDGSVELYVLDIPTGHIEQLTNAPSTATGDVVSSLNHDGSRVAFSFPRVLTETVSEQSSANNPEIYFTSVTPRPEFGVAQIANAATRNFEDPKIAPDVIAVITGHLLSNRTVQCDFHKELPFEIDQTSVQVNGTAARLLYVSPGEVVFVVPATVVDGPVEVVVNNSEGFPA